MKKLQSNFTTPKQSKRLLELGVPAWTADCCFSKSKDGEYICEGVKHIIPDDFCVQSVPFPAYPCWSVGRLMNIFDICCAISDYNDWFNTQCVPNEYVAYVIGCYERAIDSKMLDFSKLE